MPSEEELMAAASEWDEAIVAVATLRQRNGDDDGAVEVLWAAFDAGNEMVGTPLGLLLENLGREQEAREIYRRSWEGGDAFSAFNLGLLHEESGEMNEAVLWVRRAASGGDRHARRWLSRRRRAAKRAKREGESGR
ncbi:MAG: hypothetical protein QM708_16290 [Propioniciclava sp.]|uniref:hypothetical protein n=1 Tax=Propioniciclava sp. TaxID=2038686 RepID=UPI0039E2698A